MEALILEVFTRGLHRYHRLEAEVTTIGRALDNDIILSDPTIAPHHLKIIRYPEGSIELVNLSEVNPVRIGRQRLDSMVTEQLPLQIEIGRIQAQLLPQSHEVAATRPLAGNGRRSHLFGHAFWAFVLALLCVLAGGFEFHLGSYTSYPWSDLFKFVLRETVLTIGGFVLALAVLERLLVNRWEIKQLTTSVCLVYLMFYLVQGVGNGSDYLFSASWPSTLLHFTWYLLLIPAAIALYLIHISHLKPRFSLLLALLIASPIVAPSMLQSSELLLLLEDFSTAARYQNSLSSFNWHLADTVSIADFATDAKMLDPGEFAD